MAKVENFSVQYHETAYVDASGKAISFGLIIDQVLRRPHTPWRGAPHMVMGVNRQNVSFKIEKEP